MTDYIFIERTDDETREVASLVAGEFSGSKAEKIQDLLKSLGFKKGGDPTRLLHGSRLWAEEKLSE